MGKRGTNVGTTLVQRFCNIETGHYNEAKYACLGVCPKLRG